MMWTRILGIAGKFLSTRTLTLALSAVVAAGGTYVLYAIKDRGALEQELKQVKAERDAARQEAVDWQAHAGDIQQIAARFDDVWQELQDARRGREQLARAVDKQIANIRIEIPEAQEFLVSRAPAALVRVLCDDATIDPDSADCKAVDTAELSGSL